MSRDADAGQAWNKEVSHYELAVLFEAASLKKGIVALLALSSAVCTLKCT